MIILLESVIVYQGLNQFSLQTINRPINRFHRFPEVRKILHYTNIVIIIYNISLEYHIHLVQYKTSIKRGTSLSLSLSVTLSLSTSYLPISNYLFLSLYNSLSLRSRVVKKYSSLHTHTHTRACARAHICIHMILLSFCFNEINASGATVGSIAGRWVADPSDQASAAAAAVRDS